MVVTVVHRETQGGQVAPSSAQEVAVPGLECGQPKTELCSPFATCQFPNVKTHLRNCKATWPRTRSFSFGGQISTS